MPDTALALGVVRALVHGVFLVATLATSFSDLGRLPVTVLRPTGLMKLLPWGFYDALLTPGGMLALKGLMVASLAAGVAGFLTRWTTKSSALLVLFYQGLVRSFGHFNHDEMVGAYFLCVLAFSPCGDAFSLDARPRPGRGKGSGWLYGYPILLMRALLAWVYFSSALIKLRVSGLSYFGPDSLPALAVYHSLDNMHDTQYRFGLMLPHYREWTPPVVGLVLLWEALFPLAVFSKRARPWLLGFGVVFHLASVFVLNIFFPYTLAMYLVFVDWQAVAVRLSALRAPSGKSV